ncbi:MAG: hypothetical protein ACREN5_08285, partial [Gemmatimonadales bacterium]
GKGTLTSSVSASARDAQGVLASVPESEPQSPAAAPASIADDDGNGGLSEWTLAGMLLVGLVAGGAVVAVARRR